MTITAKINRVAGRVNTNSDERKTDSGHYTITISGYQLIPVAVETIETESEKANGEFYQVIPTGIFKINPAITEKEE